MNLYKLIPDFVRSKIEGRADLHNILKNCGWLFSYHSVRLISGLIVGVLVARYLGPARFGILNFVISYVLLFEPLATLGLNHIITRDIVKYPGKENLILGTSFYSRLFGELIARSITIAAVFLLKPDEKLIIIYVVIVSIGTLFNAFAVIEFWFLAYVQSKYAVISRIATILTTSFIKFVLISVQASLTEFVIAIALEKVLLGICFLIAYKIRKGNFFKWKFKFEIAKKLISQSWLLIFSGFAAGIYLKIDQVMLLKFASESETGIYAAAARLSELWYFLPAIITNSIFPSLVKLKEKSLKAYENRLQKSYNLLATLGIGLSIIISSMSTIIITSLYGKEFIQSSIILSIHIWACVFMFMRALFSKWIIAEKIYIFSLLTHLTGAISNIILNFYLIPRYGGIGAALATVISYAAAAYFSLFFHSKTKKVAKMMTRAIFSPITYFISISFIQRRDGNNGK